MTGPSSTPRGGHTPRPGTTWDTQLVRREDYVPECAASIRGTCLAEAQSEKACDTDAGECIYAAPMPSLGTRPDRATPTLRAETNRERLVLDDDQPSEPGARMNRAQRRATARALRKNRR